MAENSRSWEGQESMGSFNDSSMESQWASHDSCVGRPTPRRVGGTEGPTQSRFAGGGSSMPRPQFVGRPFIRGTSMSPPPAHYAQGVYNTGGSIMYPSQFGPVPYASGSSISPAQYGSSMSPSQYGHFGHHMPSSGGYVHMLHGSDVHPYMTTSSPYITPSSTGAFSITSSQSDKGTNVSGGSSRKSGRRSDDDEVVVSSPRKKSKAKEKKGNANKIWARAHSEKLISFMADLARAGQKVDKTFKASAFNAAAAYINNLFGTEYSSQHVRNHMKGLHRRMADITTCLNLSGAGWSEDLKMITLDREVYKTFAASNPRLKEYINRPLTWLDDLRVIVGDDAAKGDFRKVVYQSFGGTTSDGEGVGEGGGEGEGEEEQEPITSIPASNPSIPEEDVTPEFPRVGQVSGNASGSTPPSVGRRNRRVRRSLNNEPDLMAVMAANVEKVAIAIHDTQSHWSSLLGTAVYQHVEHHEDVLDECMRELLANESEARLFLAMPPPSRAKMLKKMVDRNSRRRSAHLDDDDDEGSE